ncbi:MAG TPA: protein-L-isoaspartate(D-aspartate) O-methyltransferase [Ignavibacteriaceae bacterium]|nr:protein-L-isoaspartate(D-aspartate) O-methyltransferase [Ignavibacteriaceae bacterium]
MSRTEREALVDLLSKKGINDIYVLKAIGEVQREKFIPNTMKIHAYSDIALPIGQGQTISQPYTVAFMTQELKLKKGSKVLEIGTGSGYQAAILYKMGVEVFTIERNLKLYHPTLKLFDDLGIRVRAKYGDGTLGWAEYAPFDGIIVTAGSPDVPEKLKEQLAVGGRMVIPVGSRTSQKLYVITKDAEDKFATDVIPEFSFVPLIGKEGWDK